MYGTTRPTLENCQITNNLGTGIRVLEAGLNTFDCTVSGNTSSGITVSMGSLGAYRTKFHNNGRTGLSMSEFRSSDVIACEMTNNAEGGLRLHWGGNNNTVSNCLIADNSGIWNTGGLYVEAFHATAIANCTITNNSSDTGVGGVHFERYDRASLTNCIIWGNDGEQISGEEAPVTYSNVQGGWDGVGNIDADPLFASYMGYDYLLKANSPCIDTGDPQVTDAISDWHPRWPEWHDNGIWSDMGAYGGPGNANWLPGQ